MRQTSRQMSRMQREMGRVVSVLILACLLGGCLRDATSGDGLGDPQLSGATGTCHLLIQFGDDRPEKQFELSCPEGGTVMDLLQSAAADRRIELDATGRGATAFVRAIDGVANQGGSRHNWVYYRNDQLGDRGAGVCPVQQGDRIRWTFGTYPSPETPNQSPASNRDDERVPQQPNSKQ